MFAASHGVLSDIGRLRLYPVRPQAYVPDPDNAGVGKVLRHLIYCLTKRSIPRFLFIMDYL